MSQFIMMLLAGIGNGVGDFFSKISAGKMSPYIAAMLVSIGAILTVGTYFLFIKNQPGNVLVTKAGVIYGLLGGVAIGVGMIFFFNLFAKGANISQAQPIIKSVVVLSAVILGLVFLREKMNTMQVIGMVLSVLGIYFLTK